METECKKDILNTDYRQTELKKSNYELNLFGYHQLFRNYKHFLKYLKYDFY
jgi:hypothetical protein